MYNEVSITTVICTNMLFCQATISDHQRDLSGWVYIFTLLGNFAINVLYLLCTLAFGTLPACKKAIDRKRKQREYDVWLRLNISQKKKSAESNPQNNELQKKYEYITTLYEIKTSKDKIKQLKQSIKN